MSSDDLDDVIVSYMEMFPDIPIKDVYMFFDEIQLIKDWEYFVLRVYKSYCKNIYVCGSNATMLSTELSSALRGYPLEYETYPLSFNEYCRFKGIATNSYLEQDRARLKMAFEAYNQASAFPEIVLTSSRSEQLKLLHGYFDTMILKDLAEHYKISIRVWYGISSSVSWPISPSLPPSMPSTRTSSPKGLKSVRMTCIFGLIMFVTSSCSHESPNTTVRW